MENIQALANYITTQLEQSISALDDSQKIIVAQIAEIDKKITKIQSTLSDVIDISNS